MREGERVFSMVFLFSRSLDYYYFVFCSYFSRPWLYRFSLFWATCKNISVGSWRLHVCILFVLRALLDSHRQQCCSDIVLWHAARNILVDPKFCFQKWSVWLPWLGTRRVKEILYRTCSFQGFIARPQDFHRLRVCPFLRETDRQKPTYPTIEWYLNSLEVTWGHLPSQNTGLLPTAALQ